MLLVQNIFLLARVKQPGPRSKMSSLASAWNWNEYLTLVAVKLWVLFSEVVTHRHSKRVLLRRPPSVPTVLPALARFFLILHFLSALVGSVF